MQIIDFCEMENTCKKEIHYYNFQKAKYTIISRLETSLDIILTKECFHFRFALLSFTIAWCSPMPEAHISISHKWKQMKI